MLNQDFNTRDNRIGGLGKEFTATNRKKEKALARITTHNDA